MGCGRAGVGALLTPSQAKFYVIRYERDLRLFVHKNLISNDLVSKIRLIKGQIIHVSERLGRSLIVETKPSEHVSDVSHRSINFPRHVVP